MLGLYVFNYNLSTVGLYVFNDSLSMLGLSVFYTTVFSGVCVTRSLVLYVCFEDRCLSFVLFPLAIDKFVLSVLLWYTDSAYLFGIFKLFLATIWTHYGCMCLTKLGWYYCYGYMCLVTHSTLKGYVCLTTIWTRWRYLCVTALNFNMVFSWYIDTNKLYYIKLHQLHFTTDS